MVLAPLTVRAEAHGNAVKKIWPFRRRMITDDFSNQRVTRKAVN